MSPYCSRKLSSSGGGAAAAAGAAAPPPLPRPPGACSRYSTRLLVTAENATRSWLPVPPPALAPRGTSAAATSQGSPLTGQLRSVSPLSPSVSVI